MNFVKNSEISCFTGKMNTKNTQKTTQNGINENV